ncbi:branched-chain amino acid ABC transporter permease [Candidatus Finniella inopinata]|uniref:Branched-chain amino acid ABC transporter permease n=1 Tax=Candidatus Finniella inopinata TaxID=1696036 RepID=A0A4Q7DK43_9PROT|nr:branched-chain amino acid ABC transporter permease [Candidatus Finniella inopinata]RZI46740.1 branched-chain amino acid ABC transporter permease [Candidatus Finniella inopinata]
MIVALTIGVNGLLMGLVYGLMALGLSVVFGVTRIVNFAHGEILVLSGLVMATLYNTFGINPLFTLPFLALALFAGGYGLQQKIVNRLLKTSDHSQFIALSAIGIILLNIQLSIFGSQSQFIVTPYSLQSISVGPMLIDFMRLVTAGVALLTTGILFYFYYYTSTGKAIRACADNRFTAQAIGLNDRHLYALSFGIAGIVLAVSGCLFSLLMDISPLAGPQLTLLSFTIVIIGGLTHQAGPLLGGIVLGIVEAYTAFYAQSSLKSLVSFGFLILILLIRPQGLLTRRA